MLWDGDTVYLPPFVSDWLNTSPGWSWNHHQFLFCAASATERPHKGNLLCVFRVMESWRCRQEQGRPSRCCPSLLPTRRWVELCVHVASHQPVNTFICLVLSLSGLSSGSDQADILLQNCSWDWEGESQNHDHQKVIKVYFTGPAG